MQHSLRAALATLAVLAVALAVPAGSTGHETRGDADYGYGAGLTALDASAAIGSLAAPPLALGGTGELADLAPGSGGDFNSANFSKLDREPIVIRGDRHAQGSDLAFRRKLLVAGSYQGTGFFRIARDGISQISFHRCPGSQGDVSILGDYVFVSIDTRSSNEGERRGCNDTATTDSRSSVGKEGIRILDISNVRRPRQVGFVETECGSHTHTLIPGARRSHIYVQSYPLGPDDQCTEVNHPEGEISVIEFRNDRAENAEVVGVPDVLPPTTTPDTVGCHDIGVLPGKDLAAAACLGAFALLDISNPAKPKTLSVVQNPLIELDHSAQITWDGRYAVIGDEHAGAAGGGGCSTDQASPIGAMWFYDIRDPASPALAGSYSLPRVPPVDSIEEAERFRCTTHNYQLLPMRDRSYVAVSPYYAGGLSVVDFSDPAAPEEIGHYLPQVKGVNADMWSGYWYRGRIYSNDHASRHGVSVFEVRGLGSSEVRDLGPTVNPQTQVR